MEEEDGQKSEVEKAREVIIQRMIKIETELLKYVYENKSQGGFVTSGLLLMKARELNRKHKGGVNLNYQWCFDFLNRHGFTMRGGFASADPEPSSSDSDCSRKYLLKHIGAAHLIYVATEPPRVLNKELNHVYKQSGVDDIKGTVVLCATAEGYKCPPYLVLREMPNIEVGLAISNCFMKVGGLGLVGENNLVEWIDNVWRQRPMGDRRFPSILAFSAFRGKMFNRAKVKLRLMNTDLVVLPEEDIGFEIDEAVEMKYNKWLRETCDRYSVSGNIRKVRLSDVCDWVKEAWEEYETEKIFSWFKNSCLNNSM